MLGLEDLTLDGYIRSHFKLPHEKLEAYDPWTPTMDQATIEHRTEQLWYHNIDATLGLLVFGAHAYRKGGYAAAGSLHMYRAVQAVRAIPLLAAAYGLVSIVALQTEAMQEFTPQEQFAILTGVPQPGMTQKQKVMTLAGL